MISASRVHPRIVHLPYRRGRQPLGDCSAITDRDSLRDTADGVEGPWIRPVADGSVADGANEILAWRQVAESVGACGVGSRAADTAGRNNALLPGLRVRRNHH